MIESKIKSKNGIDKSKNKIKRENLIYYVKPKFRHNDQVHILSLHSTIEFKNRDSFYGEESQGGAQFMLERERIDGRQIDRQIDRQIKNKIDIDRQRDIYTDIIKNLYLACQFVCLFVCKRQNG